ncbi:MAG: SDR family oxidoreductase [Gemmatimonadetes bacterium]|nr:SDR family oxidoreductase [Gemmatimonadota bacterium]
MDLGLAGRVALVTGASKGLGRAIAHALAREGATVVIAARTAATLAATRDAIAADTRARVIAIPTDVGKDGAVEQLVSAARAQAGAIDIVVANAGGPPSTTFATSTEAQYRAAIEQNLLASIRLAHATVPAMQARKWGRVIFLTSMAAKMPLPGLMLSNTARAGLLGFAKTLANEVAKDNVLVNTVLPGHFDTDRARELATMRAERLGVPVETLLAERQATIPVGRSGRAEEMADVVAFLASERASFVTGVALQVDGGQVSSLL